MLCLDKNETNKPIKNKQTNKQTKTKNQEQKQKKQEKKPIGIKFCDIQLINLILFSKYL